TWGTANPSRHSIIARRKTSGLSLGFRWAGGAVRSRDPATRSKPKRSAATQRRLSLPWHGCSRNRRSCCRSQERRRSSTSKKTWPRPRSTFLRAIGRKSKHWRREHEEAGRSDDRSFWHLIAFRRSIYRKKD